MKRLLLILALGLSACGATAAHAADKVTTCASVAVGVDGSSIACNPGVNWGVATDASTLAPTTMVLGCAAGSQALTVGTPVTGNTFGLPQCTSQMGKPEWEPASFWAASAANLVWDTTNNTLATLASIGYAGGGAAPTPVATPACYPMNSAFERLTLWGANGTVESVANWFGDPKAYFILDWFCPDPSGQNGYKGNYLTGYQAELLPGYQTISQLAGIFWSDKASLDALWQQNAATGAPDADLDAPAKAQQAVDWPQPAASSGGGGTMPVGAKTTGTTVYYWVPQANKIVPLPIGTAPVGTACNATPSVNANGVQMYGVPVSAVTWYGATKSLVAIAPCG